MRYAMTAHASPTRAMTMSGAMRVPRCAALWQAGKARALDRSMQKPSGAPLAWVSEKQASSAVGGCRPTPQATRTTRA